ncbi:DUF1217 domain-containing protein [Rhizobium sp. CFBP 8762]|uniref:DUF1217 domain-containing protein n=1 Tax=Rhizobium sp. CFBP 8762 TaxID=2775279 RepID=UPI0017806048|nr:DUF1217 domain-containing protein [Rhizobium sp. CFBP 8762]MBD8553294.1 DUF1217 domain-containing protein [Rhizobium sp. CFBP 8762]
MVSTYVSYMNITANMPTSLERVGKDPIVARDIAYYRENISSVTTIDEFINNDRLYSYAMKAHGLEEMTYAKGLMRKVLESDLNDPTSYANKLTDERYRNFAAAFNFTASTKSVQNDVQIEKLIGLYSENFERIPERNAIETYYFKEKVDEIKSVDGLWGNQRLREYALIASGMTPGAVKYVSYDYFRAALTSDLNDPDSFANKEGYSALKLAKLFNFDADGGIKTGEKPQTDEQKKEASEQYVINSSDRITRDEAALNNIYFQQQVDGVTTVDEIVSDRRLVDYINVAAGLSNPINKETIKQILTADPNEVGGIIDLAKPDVKETYRWINAQFNFDREGNVKPGGVQSAAQRLNVDNRYNSKYDDADVKRDELAIKLYKSAMTGVETLKQLLGNPLILKVALSAHNLDYETASNYKLQKVLTSDLSDPKSYVYTLKDARYVELAKSFNFESDGKMGRPLSAQSAIEVTAITNKYMSEKVRHLTGSERREAKDKAEKEIEFYKKKIDTITSRTDLLSDKRLVSFMLTANGFDPEAVTTDFLGKIFTSNLDDPSSFANQQTDPRYRTMVTSFNFNTKGEVVRPQDKGVQSSRGYYETMDLYLRQTLEEQSGEDSEGVRLALYFERKASSISSAYDIIADTPLMEVIRTVYNIPEEIKAAEVEAQKATLDHLIDIKDFQDPEKLEGFLKRFAALYDVVNEASTAPSLSIMLGAGAAGGISADTLMTMSRLRYRL